MYSIQEAKERLFAAIKTLPPRMVQIENAQGHVLAKNCYAPVSMPLFDHAAVDGYAVKFDTSVATTTNTSFVLIGEIKAGDPIPARLSKGKAIRIFTGAPIPAGTDAVVMQEWVTASKSNIEVPASYLKKGSNIRYRATSIKKNELALPKGTLLNPAAIGFLGSLGIANTPVWPKPVSAILSTGNELVAPGKSLASGQIYESNSLMLAAAFEASGYEVLEVKSNKDQRNIIYKSIDKMLSNADIVVITGGISVGKYDLVKDILLALGVKELFYKVAQKPGKPMFAGKKGNKLIFALPGNPAAALVCFYEYVLPVLGMMSGKIAPSLQTKNLPLTSSFQLKGDRAVFLKALVSNEKVTILEGQESNILRSFAACNALVYLPSGERWYTENELVETHLLPAFHG